MEEYHAIFAERMIQHPAVQESAIRIILRFLVQRCVNRQLPKVKVGEID